MSGFVDIRELRVKPIIPAYDGPYPGPAGRRPDWLKAPAAVGKNYRELKQLVQDLKLHTVCESAACPNLGECWNRKTATFMILGAICTRPCGFCAVERGRPPRARRHLLRHAAHARAPARVGRGERGFRRRLPVGPRDGLPAVEGAGVALHGVRLSRRDRPPARWTPSAPLLGRAATATRSGR